MVSLVLAVTLARDGVEPLVMMPRSAVGLFVTRERVQRIGGGEPLVRSLSSSSEGGARMRVLLTASASLTARETLTALGRAGHTVDLL